MKYRVLLEQDEDGIYVAEVPALPGCLSQGDTREEALNNIAIKQTEMESAHHNKAGLFSKCSRQKE